MLFVFCDYFITGTVIANRIAKGQVDIQGQRPGDQFSICVMYTVPVIWQLEIFRKLHCRWVGSVSWTGKIILFNQVPTDNNRFFHY